MHFRGGSKKYFDIVKYFERIHFYEKPTVDIKTLSALHKCHILSVPFENLDILLKKPLCFNVEHLWEKIIERKRGGICYEINSLFFLLLKEIGFKVKMISARVLHKNGIYGEEFDHLAMIIDLEQPWLVDVGFGGSFLEPIQVVLDSGQMDSTGLYKIVRFNENYLKLCRSQDGNNYKDLFIFTMKGRKLEDYYEMIKFHQTSPDSLYTHYRFCTISRENNGQVTLKDSRIIETVNGVRKERVIDTDEEIKKLLKQRFGIYI